MNFTCHDFYHDRLARARILKSAMACCMQAVGSRVLAGNFVPTHPPCCTDVQMPLCRREGEVNC